MRGCLGGLLVSSKKKRSPLVSVIIPTYNSEKTISRCIMSIKNQTYRNIEIIVVDGGSRDRTVEIAKDMGASTYVLPGSKMSDATNFGILKARGKYVYRVDSDVILDKNLIEEAVHKCEIEGFDGVCVFWLPEDNISFWSKIRKIEKSEYIKHPEFVGSIKYSKPVLGARFLRKDVVLSLGMMDEDVPLAGEDYAFYIKLAESPYKIGVISSTERHIGEPKTLQEIAAKNFRYGCSMRSILDNTSSQKRSNRRIFWGLLPFGRKYYLEAFRKALDMGFKYMLGFVVYELTVYIFSLLGLLYCTLTNKEDTE